MKKFSFWIFAAIMTICCATTMLTSCSDTIDTPVVPINPSEEVTEADLKQALIGLHIDASDYVLGEEAFRVWDMKDDNTFTAYDLYYNDSLEFVIDTLKGTWKPLANQEVWWDETISDKLQGFTIIYDKEDVPFEIDEPDETYFGFLTEDDEDENDEAELFFLSDYALDELAMLDAEKTEENAQARTRAAQFGNTSNEAVSTIGQGLAGGVTRENIANEASAKQFFDSTYGKMSTAGAKKFYNPNEAKGLFTRDNWRDQEKILFFVDKNTGTLTETVGSNTYSFAETTLPWSEGTKTSNLPLNFCDDLYPENGWDLVMNSCGSTVAQNLNYFALYNKYTGILRIFTYVPNTVNVSTANDHAWEVTLSEDLAQHLNLKFGLPMTDKIVNKALIGMDRGNDYSMYVTPYVSSSSSDQKITPNPGWWAFDIDLSLYREGFTTFGQELRLQMRAWNEDNITLNSKINAQIKEKKVPPTFGLSSVTGIIGQVKTGYSTFNELINTVSSITLGNWWESMMSVFKIAQKGYGVYKGIKGEVSKIGASTEPYYVTKQYIDGTISTDGLYKGSRAVSGIYSPTFSLSEFYTENSTFGQGVWNLRHAPVVYDFNEYFTTYDLEHWPKERINCLNCVFDPSSVDVVLNPRVFNTGNVEYVEVYSMCGLNTTTKHDANDNYRKAFGMNINAPAFRSHDRRLYEDYESELLTVKFDSQADYPDEYKTGSFPVTVKNQDKAAGETYNLYGRGNSDYLIEPTCLTEGATYILPCYEVTVTVVIKMKGFDEPLYYVRKYLPEIKQFELHDTKVNYSRSLAQYEKIKNDPLRKGHTAQLDIQMQHFKNVLLAFRPEFEKQDTYFFAPLYFTRDYDTYAFNLFDGNASTNCRCSTAKKEQGEWRWVFQCNRPIKPKYYAITSSSHAEEYRNTTNPKIWALYAKNPNEGWVKLDARDSQYVPEEKMPDGNSQRRVYECRWNPGTYTDFKLVVSKAWTSENRLVYWVTKDSGFLELAELEILETLDEQNQ